MKRSRIQEKLFVIILLMGIPAADTAGSTVLKALRVDSPIRIDGIPDESVWFRADSVDRFIQFQPVNNKPSEFRTVVRILYDTKRLYAAFWCYDPEPHRISASITKRDDSVERDDVVGLVLDTFNDNSSAYLFAVNPLGTQEDIRIADNGRTMDMAWDIAWESAARIHDWGWTAEIAIPFEGLKYNKNNTVWGFNAGRGVPRALEIAWTSGNLTDNYRVSQFGDLTGLDLRHQDLKSWALIPYVQAQFQKGRDPQTRAGVDMRVNVTSNLGLDGTVNPDFATVEGDVEQVNLTRFELSYPEKRPFFLEGAENYSTRIQQFYSRRIGEIPWGAKINGKIGHWKLNALATQADPASAGAEVDPGEKALYSVFRINRELARGSNIGLIGANRFYDGLNSGSLGLSATLFFTDVLGMTSQLIRSHGSVDNGIWAWFLRPAYDSKFTHFHVRYSHYGTGVRENMNSIGFIRDDDRREFDTNLRHIFWINGKVIESIEPSNNYNQYWSQEGVLRSWENNLDLEITLLKQWELEVEWEEEFKRYEKDFRNRVMSGGLVWDNKKGTDISFSYRKGINYDRDMEQIRGGMKMKILSGWNVEYRFSRYWFRPAREDDNSWIHYIRSSYYLNKDLFVKVFYQTRHRVEGGWISPELDLLRKTLQVVFVWRFLPPFGSLQLAYQEGTTRYTETAGMESSFFAKLSWVF
ncbi:MAG TPA: hypothetical protein ENN03_10275 [bacterium]|nr:hypothetical protein [bacterium]